MVFNTTELSNSYSVANYTLLHRNNPNCLNATLHYRSLSLVIVLISEHCSDFPSFFTRFVRCLKKSLIFLDKFYNACVIPSFLNARSNRDFIMYVSFFRS